MHNIKDRKEFIRHARFIIDEINQRSFHLSVIISRFFDFDSQNIFELQMNVVFLSSAFPKTFKTEFKESIKIVRLIKNPQFNIEVEVFLIPESTKFIQNFKRKLNLF